MKFVSVLSGFLLGALLIVSVAHAGGPLNLPRCVGGPNHGFACSSDDHCPGGECQDVPLMCSGGLNTGNVCLTNADCSGGACVNVGRFRGPLSRICQSGPNKGAGCKLEGDCANNPCILDLRAPGTIKGTLTLIVDDTLTAESTGATGNCTYDAPQRATTLLLEVRKSGKRHLLSQAFRCLLPSSNGGNAFWAESVFNAAVDNSSILNNLLFRVLDEIGGFGNMGQALRDIYGSTGTPVILSTQKSVNSSKYADREGDDLASVLRVDVIIGFVP